MKSRLQVHTFAALFLCVFAVMMPAQTGAPFDLSHNVIASGGGTSSGTNGVRTFSVEGTIGQGFAGTTSSSTPSQFSVQGGFWAFRPLAPTAATVTVSGRVLGPRRRGLANAQVILTDVRGETRTALTTTFGHYSFADIPVGETFVVTVAGRRYRVTPVVITVNDEITGLDLVVLVR